MNSRKNRKTIDTANLHTYDANNKALIEVTKTPRKYTWNEALETAKTLPKQKKLFGEIWHEGEICVEFSDTNTGKSILAVQIGDSISSGKQINGFTMEAKQPVIYYDLELSKQQIGYRYIDEYTNESYKMDESYIRFDSQDLNELLEYKKPINKCWLQIIEEHIEKYKAKVIIIDNITYLNSNLENSKEATEMMQQLKIAKDKHNLSFLIIAHTPKRDKTKPLELDNLKGSSTINQFIDSAFAIGKSYEDTGLRYLKQVKTRNGAITYGEDNVYICEPSKHKSSLSFEFKYTDSEWNHLQKLTAPAKDAKAEIIAQAKDLRKQGMSLRDIALILNISKSSADNYSKMDTR